MSADAHLTGSHLPTIRQLQCFLAVAQELNFRRAAERLSMTQPPLTRQIQRLEDLLGQTLFDRNTHDVTLTRAGQALVAKAEAILCALKCAEAGCPACRFPRAHRADPDAERRTDCTTRPAAGGASRPR